ncbi:hypothetical protein PHISP_05222 [Aspergillus sp. HF37]|nr:hypothetical protein PHISP_05222 [Aspergillus sp. HF37]
MSPSPSHSDESPTATGVGHEAQATEEARYEEIKQNVASISSLRGVDHLLKMEELIASNHATVDWLSKTDIVILEVMDPRAIPPAIKEKIEGINMTITMRISAAEQRPARVMEVRGDLFQAPRNAVLMHACNTKGFWGKGIAAEFRDRYPEAYRIYRQFCQDCLKGPTYKPAPLTPEQKNKGDTTNAPALQKPEGECLLIPPQLNDTDRNGYRHWIACLFTKAAPGRIGVRGRILVNTGLAVEDMMRQIEAVRARDDMAHVSVHDAPPGELWSCRLNAGLFAVKWSYTKEVLEQAGIDVVVVHP